MNSSGVPDILVFSRLSKSVADLKGRAQTTRTEAVTGRYEDITAATKGDVGSAHLLNKAIADVQAYQQNLALGENRAQRSQSVLNVLATQSNRIATESASAVGRNDLTTLRTNAEDAHASITSIFAALNTTEGGRALFGGDATDRAPLGSPNNLITDVKAIIAGATDLADAELQLDTYFNDPAGGFLTSIYKGGANPAPDIEIAPGVRISASTKADAQPIKDLIRGLVEIAASGSVNFGSPKDLVNAGSSRILGAKTSLSELRASIGVGEARISATKARYQTEETILTNLFNEKTARDPFEAASELQLLETQLEASYLMTARLARLTIADYIR